MDISQSLKTKRIIHISHSIKKTDAEMIADKDNYAEEQKKRIESLNFQV